MYAAQFIKNIIVMIQHDMMSTSPFCGKLHTRDELDNYEQTWHSQIFLPQWNSLKMDVCTCINTDTLLVITRVHNAEGKRVLNALYTPCNLQRVT